MPRQARIDAPGLLQHIMARGIDGIDIFRDNYDYKSFLERLALILEETQTQCFAWALLPNHFHLLLRTNSASLSKVMRRLMTGYAVSYNKRHARRGHLFQNRYRSTVCEDTYLLDVMRYIHLNPLRVGLVEDLKELDRFVWTGHSSVIGKRKNPLNHKRLQEHRNKPGYCNKKALAERTIEKLLLYFGDELSMSRRKYRQFIKKGFQRGKRPDLQGGGVIEDYYNNKKGIPSLENQKRNSGKEFSDQRILGGASFVEQVLDKVNEFDKKEVNNRIFLDELIRRVCTDIEIDIKVLTSSKRDQKTSYARSIISYMAAIELKYAIKEIAIALWLSGKSVSRCIVRGKEIFDSKPKMLKYISVK
jgi:putative transposase